MFYFEKLVLHMFVFIQQNDTCLNIVTFHKYLYLIILQNQKRKRLFLDKAFVMRNITDLAACL